MQKKSFGIISKFMDEFPFVATLLRGVGQIMLQENALTGLLFLIGIFYGSPIMGAGAVLAVLSGTAAAKLLKYDQNEIQQGLYGFSAALVGVALTLFFKPVFLVWLFIVIGSAAAIRMQHFFIVKKIPVFTLPFVLCTWTVMFLFQKIIPIGPSPLLSGETAVMDNLLFAFHGYGQVIFQGSLFAGIIFFVAVLFHSPLAAIFGLAGSILAGAFASFIHVSPDLIGMGLLSYNAVLCAIVFTGKKTANIVWMVVSTLLSVMIYILMAKYNFVPLTFPFVAATMVTLMVKRFAENLPKKDKLEPTDS